MTPTSCLFKAEELLKQPECRRSRLLRFFLQLSNRAHPCGCWLLLLSRSVMSDSLQLHGLKHAWLPCPSLSLGVCSKSYLLRRWYYPTISSSVVTFSTHLQSFPASGSFPMSQLCIKWPKYWNFSFSISPSTESSVLTSCRIDWMSQSKGLSTVFSSIIVQKHQFFSPQPSLWSNLNIRTWLLEKP